MWISASGGLREGDQFTINVGYRDVLPLRSLLASSMEKLIKFNVGIQISYFVFMII